MPTILSNLVDRLFPRWKWRRPTVSSRSGMFARAEHVKAAETQELTSVVLHPCKDNAYGSAPLYTSASRLRYRDYTACPKIVSCSLMGTIELPGGGCVSRSFNASSDPCCLNWAIVVVSDFGGGLPPGDDTDPGGCPARIMSFTVGDTTIKYFGYVAGAYLVLSGNYDGAKCATGPDRPKHCDCSEPTCDSVYTVTTACGTCDARLSEAGWCHCSEKKNYTDYLWFVEYCS